jgi:hypothetical protein
VNTFIRVSGTFGDGYFGGGGEEIREIEDIGGSDGPSPMGGGNIIPIPKEGWEE